jgi:hypothetical protein
VIVIAVSCRHPFCGPASAAGDEFVQGIFAVTDSLRRAEANRTRKRTPQFPSSRDADTQSFRNIVKG